MSEEQKKRISDLSGKIIIEGVLLAMNLLISRKQELISKIEINEIECEWAEIMNEAERRRFFSPEELTLDAQEELFIYILDSLEKVNKKLDALIEKSQG